MLFAPVFSGEHIVLWCTNRPVNEEVTLALSCISRGSITGGALAGK